MNYNKRVTLYILEKILFLLKNKTHVIHICCLLVSRILCCADCVSIWVILSWCSYTSPCMFSLQRFLPFLSLQLNNYIIVIIEKQTLKYDIFMYYINRVVADDEATFISVFVMSWYFNPFSVI